MASLIRYLDAAWNFIDKSNILQNSPYQLPFHRFLEDNQNPNKSKAKSQFKRWKHLVRLDDFINSTRLDPVIADQGTKRNVSKRIGIKPLITSMSRGQPVVNPLILGCCLTQQSLHLLEFQDVLGAFLVGNPSLNFHLLLLLGRKESNSSRGNS